MLVAENVTINYGSRASVADLSLQLQPGEIAAILGPNGAGKSTFLRALNGALKPAKGAIMFEGRSIASYPRRSIARHIAVVAQEAELRFPFTVFEFVLGGRYAWASAGNWGWETDRDVEVVQNVLKEAELSELQHRSMSELSGGERQRAVLARALATEARVLLLDEPTANLDLSHQATILQLVRNRCEEQGVAAVVITHDINLASEFSSKVLLMKNGRSVAVGQAREVLRPELLKEVFAVDVLVDAHPVTGVPRITPVHQAHR
jgi:iron complex transport system ATP-binding protein